MILTDANMKTLFLDVVKSAKRRYRFRIENFCIMGNHFHLILQPLDSENLSRIMQWIMSVFAMRYNSIHGLSGHVWGERFFSRVIADLRQFLWIFHYIDINPVIAGLVPRRREWPFGGFIHRRTGRNDIVDPLPPWLTDALRTQNIPFALVE